MSPADAARADVLRAPSRKDAAPSDLGDQTKDLYILVWTMVVVLRLLEVTFYVNKLTRDVLRRTVGTKTYTGEADLLIKLYRGMIGRQEPLARNKVRHLRRHRAKLKGREAQL